MRIFLQIGDRRLEIDPYDLTSSDYCPDCGVFKHYPREEMMISVVDDHNGNEPMADQTIALPSVLQDAAERHCGEYACACEYQRWRSMIWKGDGSECQGREHDFVFRHRKENRFAHCQRCGFIPNRGGR